MSEAIVRTLERMPEYGILNLHIAYIEGAAGTSKIMPGTVLMLV
jgi:hypothetical protein